MKTVKSGSTAQVMIYWMDTITEDEFEERDLAVSSSNSKELACDEFKSGTQGSSAAF
jgi:hypothetical protein